MNKFPNIIFTIIFASFDVSRFWWKYQFEVSLSYFIKVDHVVRIYGRVWTQKSMALTNKMKLCKKLFILPLAVTWSGSFSVYFLFLSILIENMKLLNIIIYYKAKIKTLSLFQRYIYLFYVFWLKPSSTWKIIHKRNITNK